MKTALSSDDLQILRRTYESEAVEFLSLDQGFTLVTEEDLCDGMIGCKILRLATMELYHCPYGKFESIDHLLAKAFEAQPESYQAHWVSGDNFLETINLRGSYALLAYLASKTPSLESHAE